MHAAVGALAWSSLDAMLPSMKHISLADVLQLPVRERIELVEAIWDSIAEVPESVEVTDEQRAELDKRLEAYRANPSATSPWSEVKARILQSR